MVRKKKEQKQPKLIILEGTDRCGKTTLQLTLNKKFSYLHPILDRGPVGFMTYNEIFDRDICYKEYKEVERGLKKIPHLMIYLYCDLEEQLRRCEATNELIQDFEYHREVYEKYFIDSELTKIAIDTTYMKPEQIIDYLINLGLL